MNFESIGDTFQPAICKQAFPVDLESCCGKKHLVKRGQGRVLNEGSSKLTSGSKGNHLLLRHAENFERTPVLDGFRLDTYQWGPTYQVRKLCREGCQSEK